MKFNYYDIESLENVFTNCNYKASENIIDIFYLIDDDNLKNQIDFTKLTNIIYEKNKNFNGQIYFYDLHQENANKYMAKSFGVSDSQDINNPNIIDTFNNEFRLTCDTDSNYNEEHDAFIMGYNSYQYDTTMLANYFCEVFMIDIDPNTYQETYHYEPTSAYILRQHNDELFNSYRSNMPNYLVNTNKNNPNNWNDPHWLIRRNMLRSGRHLDVARLNEKQSKVGLKRLLGYLGYQILESDKLKPNTSKLETIEEIYDLIAYNVSDVVNLEKLFQHPFYQGQFSLKKGLLNTYPETIYDKKKNEYAPDINNTKVRRDRLNIDSTSAQFATKTLCPYGHIKDYETVSFMYPSKNKAKEWNIKQINVLDYCKEFFYDSFKQPELREKFDYIYNFYKYIENKNFNDSKNYNKDYPLSPNKDDIINEIRKVYQLNTIAFPNNNIEYFYQNGTPSSCYVTFSTGGIHGAEYNLKLFNQFKADYENLINEFDYVKSIYPNPIDLKLAKTITLPNNKEEPFKKYLKSGATNKKAEYKTPKEKPAILFIEKTNKSTELNKKYNYTSYDLVNHNDFDSYYPNMLIAMEAFDNPGLGYDRYSEIYQNKILFGNQMKDKSLDETTRKKAAIQREGTKLILNSASGAGDNKFDSPIKVSNKIISMRIIGQLFTWLIAQKQVLAGAKMPSTNTDGIYSVLDEETNQNILDECSKIINIKIEPELMYLISKDSNNRIEYKVKDNTIDDIITAGGASLSCYDGPTPTQSLAHPAIIDWALAEYLSLAATNYQNAGMEKLFDEQLGLNILKASFDKFKDKTKLLIMFQNILASSIGSHTYIYGIDPITQKDIILQHYNRVFIYKDNTPNSLHLKAAVARKITPATLLKRKNDGGRLQEHDYVALNILDKNGLTKTSIPSTHEASLKKITNIEPNWFMYIANQDLHLLSDEQALDILNNLDLDKYNQILKNTFEKTWYNENYKK